jgi:hypothetical protein
MDHLAIPVSDQERSRRFNETYFGLRHAASRKMAGQSSRSQPCSVMSGHTSVAIS